MRPAPPAAAASEEAREFRKASADAEAAQASGDSERARRIYEEYLKRYPEGNHKAEARRLLKEAYFDRTREYAGGRGWRVAGVDIITDRLGPFILKDFYLARVWLVFDPEVVKVATLSKDSWEVRDSESKGRKFEVVTFISPDEDKTSGLFTAALGITGPQSADGMYALAFRLRKETSWVGLKHIPTKGSEDANPGEAKKPNSEEGASPSRAAPTGGRGWQATRYAVGNSIGGIVISDAYFASIMIEFNPGFSDVAKLSRENWEVHDSESKNRDFQVFMFSKPEKDSTRNGHWRAVLKVFGPKSVEAFRGLSFRLKGEATWVKLKEVPRM